MALWESATRAGWVNPVLLTPPSEFIPVWIGLVRSGELWPHVEWTGLRIMAGFALSALLGMALAIACHLLWVVRAGSSWVIEIIRAIPPLALLPAFLLLFGIGFKFPVAMIVWVAWIPVFLNTLDGLDEVDQNIREAAWEFCPMRTVVRTVVLPVAAPQILTGLRLAMGSCFLVIVVAEIMGSTVGLGYYIQDASSTFRIPEMYAAIATLGVMAFLANWLVVRVALLAWPHLRDL